MEKENNDLIAEFMGGKLAPLYEIFKTNIKNHPQHIGNVRANSEKEAVIVYCKQAKIFPHCDGYTALKKHFKKGGKQ